MQLSQESKLKDVVLNHPAAAVVLEKAGLDYCCGGKQTLGEACMQAGMPAEELLARLQEAAGADSPEAQNWAAAPLGALTGYIVEKHHGYVREALPRISQHLDKVAEKHGERHPELFRIRQAFDQVGREMVQHMQKEEMILFPFIQQMSDAVESGAGLYAPFFGSVQQPVAMMMQEHDAAGGLVNEMHNLSGGYAAPADGCTTYELVYRELAEFDHDLRTHVHLENNILFPRAVELEQKLTYR
ncbi:MAG: iron-sulfur cluster repair di-iron protein [Acidobacteriia bacterium]|nr:iron-sulfur cluster repair di-iron protein [Terriglobia bacterium]